jgi:putative spermidine/putrescine transport system substrate-binding protein
MNRFNTTIALAALIAGASLTSGAQAQDQGKLTVAWYGGNWGDAFKACVADPFTKATGVTVVPEIGTSTTTLAKLQQQKNAPTLDVAWLDGGISELAHAAGVVDSLDAKAIPNLANVVPQARYAKDGTTFAVGTGYYSLGLTYSTKDISTPPTSWEDLWKKDYAGAVTIPSPSNSSGVPFIFFLSKIWNVPATDMSKTFERIKQLEVAAFFDSSGQATNAFQSGEAVIGAHFNVGAWDLIDKGLPIGFVVPKEGVWATDARLHLVKGAANKEAAQKFIDTALTKEASACLAEKLYLGPSVEGVTVTGDAAKKLPWGQGGSIKNLQLLDWNEVNAKRSEITDIWNRDVARR